MYNQKVVWSEGMLMKPHHFQQQERYLEGNLNFRLSSLSRFGWGVEEIDIDREALENGTFSLRSLKAVLVDGTSINIPAFDEAPGTRDFREHFSPSSDILDVFLALPVLKRGSQACRMAEESGRGKLTRYREEYMDITDENTGTNEHQVSVAARQVEIRFRGESLDDYTFIKIAELIRSQAGTYSLKDDFIPAALTISSSPYLLKYVGRVFEKLVSKGNSLRSRQGRQSDDMAEFGSSDITNLWFLFIYNSSIPTLKHLYDSPDAHPEKLYLALIKLLGELSTFSTNYLPSDIPPYRHDDLITTFKGIEEKLGALTEVVSSSRFTPIPLKSAGQNLYSGEIKDEGMIERSKVYLAVSGDFPAELIIEKVPKMTKVCSRDTIDLIISANMPGLGLTHTARPPSSIAVKMGYQYFLVENYGQYWEEIKKTGSIAISLPYELKGARVELVAVRE